MSAIMFQTIQSAEAILRGGSTTAPSARLSLRRLLVMISGLGAFYGAVMGSFSASSWIRSLQILISATKVPVLLLITFLISLPSFYVFNSLLGLRKDFIHSLTALIGAQAGLAIVLASLAPFTALWYLSVGDYNSAILFNAAMFALASLSAQFILRRSYRPLIARDARHLIMLRLWLVIYMFVGIQMGWVLRPFVGSPAAAVHFFRQDAFSNAYVAVFDIICDVFRKLLG